VTACPIWRRNHGNELSAYVLEKEPKAYIVAVCHTSAGMIRQLPRLFTALEPAKAAADAFLRREFSHRCSMEFCGDWMCWA
jgi:hypothetical protein